MHASRCGDVSIQRQSQTCMGTYISRTICTIARAFADVTQSKAAAALVHLGPLGRCHAAWGSWHPRGCRWIFVKKTTHEIWRARRHIRGRLVFVVYRLARLCSLTDVYSRPAPEHGLWTRPRVPPRCSRRLRTCFYATWTKQAPMASRRCMLLLGKGTPMW